MYQAQLELDEYPSPPPAPCQEITESELDFQTKYTCNLYLWCDPKTMEFHGFLFPGQAGSELEHRNEIAEQTDRWMD